MLVKYTFPGSNSAARALRAAVSSSGSLASFINARRYEIDSD